MERTAEWSATGLEHLGTVKRRGSIPLRSFGEVSELVRGLTANEVSGKPSASSSLALSASTRKPPPKLRAAPSLLMRGRGGGREGVAKVSLIFRA